MKIIIYSCLFHISYMILLNLLLFLLLNFSFSFTIIIIKVSLIIINYLICFIKLRNLSVMFPCVFCVLLLPKMILNILHISEVLLYVMFLNVFIKSIYLCMICYKFNSVLCFYYFFNYAITRLF